MRSTYLPAEAGDQSYAGQRCEVLEAVRVSNFPDEWPFRIRFSNGHELEAFAGELDPIPEVPSRTKPIARSDLAILLDNECYPTAADKIRGGADARRVLNELRPFVPQHNDEESRNAVGTFQEICAGDLEVA